MLCRACDISIGNKLVIQRSGPKEAKKPPMVFEPCNSVAWLLGGQHGTPVGVQVSNTSLNMSLGTHKAQ